MKLTLYLMLAVLIGVAGLVVFDPHSYPDVQRVGR
jgi:hypothetical protein